MKLSNHSRASRAASAEQHGSAWPPLRRRRSALHTVLLCEPTQTTDAAVVPEGQTPQLFDPRFAEQSCCAEAPLGPTSAPSPAAFLEADATLPQNRRWRRKDPWFPERTGAHVSAGFTRKPDTGTP